MAYTTQAAIEAEISSQDLIALTDDKNLGLLDTTVLNQVIANASNEINRKVSAIYDVPFAEPIPTAVQAMALTIVCYRLYRRRLTPDEKNNFAEDYKDVRDFLNLVNKGEAHIDQAPARSFTQGALTGRTTIFAGSALTNDLSNTL